MAKRVLIVEDNSTDAAVVNNLLVQEGLDVTIAINGQEGIKKALDIKPDLIILDIILPDISGFDVCARLKAEEALRDTIIVMLTIKDSLDDIKKAFQVNADDYIVKLPDPGFLMRKVKLYLGLR
jgi:DNA-binding response OmpR family regulator